MNRIIAALAALVLPRSRRARSCWRRRHSPAPSGSRRLASQSIYSRTPVPAVLPTGWR